MTAQPTTVLAKGTEYQSPVYANDSGVDGPTAVIVGGMHGNEEAGREATEAFIDCDPHRGRVFVVPYMNPVAIAEGTYADSNGVDMADQWQPAQDPGHHLAKDFWKFVDKQPGAKNPRIFIDNHTSVRARSMRGSGVGQMFYPTPSARKAAMRAKAYLNDCVMPEHTYDRVHRWDVGNDQNDKNDNKLIDRVGWLLDVDGAIIETGRQGTNLSERVRWQIEANRAFLRACGMQVVPQSEGRALLARS